MNGKWTIFVLLVFGIGIIYWHTKDTEELRHRLTQIESRLSSIDSAVADVKTGNEFGSVCTTSFPGGVYELMTNTVYGPSDEPNDYEISHVSVVVGDWNVNAGIRWNSFSLPVGLYFDYDGDGMNDTAIAARLAREIPIVGSSLADKLIANADTQQRLYAVFSCEWEKAEFTSSDAMAAGASDASDTLWNLIHEYANEISTWIDNTSAADNSLLETK